MSKKEDTDQAGAVVRTSPLSKKTWKVPLRAVKAVKPVKVYMNNNWFLEVEFKDPDSGHFLALKIDNQELFEEGIFPDPVEMVRVGMLGSTDFTAGQPVIMNCEKCFGKGRYYDLHLGEEMECEMCDGLGAIEPGMGTGKGVAKKE